MPKIKLFVETGFAGCSHEDFIEVDDAEWKAMTEEEQEIFLEEEAREFMGNYINFGARVIEEN